MTEGDIWEKANQDHMASPLSMDRVTLLLNGVNSNQPGSQGSNTRQVWFQIFGSLYKVGTCESGTAKGKQEHKTRQEVNLQSQPASAPTRQNTGRQKD